MEPGRALTGTRGIAIAGNAIAIANATVAGAKRSSMFPATCAVVRASIRASNAAELGADLGDWRFAPGVKAGELAVSA
jgi:hypothetical protein